MLLWKFLACYYKSYQLPSNVHAKVLPRTCTDFAIRKVREVKEREELKQCYLSGSNYFSV